MRECQHLHVNSRALLLFGYRESIGCQLKCVMRQSQDSNNEVMFWQHVKSLSPDSIRARSLHIHDPMESNIAEQFLFVSIRSGAQIVVYAKYTYIIYNNLCMYLSGVLEKNSYKASISMYHK